MQRLVDEMSEPYADRDVMQGFTSKCAGLSAADFDWVWAKLAQMPTGVNRREAQAVCVLLLGVDRRLEAVVPFLQQKIDDTGERINVLYEVLFQLPLIAHRAGFAEPSLEEWRGLYGQLNDGERDYLKDTYGQEFAKPQRVEQMIAGHMKLTEWEQRSLVRVLGKGTVAYPEEKERPWFRMNREAVAQMIAAGVMDASARESYLKQALETSENTVLHQLLEAGELEEIVELPQYPELLTRMGENAPEALGALILKGAVPEETAEDQFTVWATRNSVGARDWLAAHGAELPTETRQALQISMALAAEKTGHEDEAAVWREKAGR